ncbi:unnamed protein product, partial [Laminaria digitata]
SCILLSIFVLVEIILLVPPYGTVWPVMLGFVIMMLTAATCLNRYFWSRMFRPFLQLAGATPVKRGSGECCCCCLRRGQDSRQVRLLRAAFVLVYMTIYGITISSLVLEQTISTTNGRDPNPWMYFSFQWAGGFVLLLVSAWFVDIFLMTVRVLRFCRRRFLHGARGEGEKSMLPLWAFPLLWLATFVILVSVASTQGTKDPVVRTIEVPMANLPTCLDGYSLAMISDIHAGPTVGRAEIARHVDAINDLGADAIVMVGDLVDDQVEDIGTIVEPISDFSAPDGQFFVLGNHEEYTGQAQKWAEFVADRGFTVLEDARVTLPLGGEAADDGCFFYLAGVSDYESSPDYDAALDGRDAGVATVLLAHQPTQVNEAVDYSVGLQLSGHTHGGQVFPYHVLAYIDQGYVSGLHKKDETFLYVSEGAVGWGPRMRLLSTTEYTLVVLRSPELFSDADTSTTESTRATGAAGVLLLLSFVYCLGYPIVKAFRRAKEARDPDFLGAESDGVGVEEGGAVRRRVVAGEYAS